MQLILLKLYHQNANPAISGHFCLHFEYYFSVASNNMHKHFYFVSFVCQQLFLQAVSLRNAGPEPLQLLLELSDGHLPVQLHRL